MDSLLAIQSLSPFLQHAGHQQGIDPGEILGEQYTAILERAETLRQYLEQHQPAQKEIMTHAAFHDASFDPSP